MIEAEHKRNETKSAKIFRLIIYYTLTTYTHTFITPKQNFKIFAQAKKAKKKKKN